MNCPKCGSDNTQKLQVVFEQGTYGDESKGYVGSAPVTLQTTGRSLLAAKYSPPKKAAPVLTILLGLIVAFCLGPSLTVARTFSRVLENGSKHKQ